MAAVAASYLPILLFLAVALGLSGAFVFLPMIAAKFTGAARPYADKLAEYECGFPAFTVRNLTDRAAELIPESVVEMDRFFRQSRRFSAGGAKLGRNDPCFCGSGKKFKKCCGRQ